MCSANTVWQPRGPPSVDGFLAPTAFLPACLPACVFAAVRVGAGRYFRTKINSNIGNSAVSSSIEEVRR